ncbi:MAG: ankyrin repeat protein [Alphaproteobacteria bacterium]|jgi:ankyrin repeat protein
MRAAWNGQRTAVQMLLDKKANTSLKDNNGNTALTYALGADQDEIASLLLQLPGADDDGELDVEVSEERVALIPRTQCASASAPSGP